MRDENEAILMLYLADELSPADRGSLATLAALDRLDRAVPMGDAFSTSVARRTWRAVEQKQLDELRRRTTTERPQRALIGRRGTMAATIALLLAGGLIWWGYEANRVRSQEDFGEVKQASKFDPDPELSEELAQRYVAALAVDLSDSRSAASLTGVEEELDDLAAARSAGDPLTGMQ